MLRRHPSSSAGPSSTATSCSKARTPGAGVGTTTAQVGEGFRCDRVDLKSERRRLPLDGTAQNLVEMFVAERVEHQQRVQPPDQLGHEATCAQHLADARCLVFHTVSYGGGLT